MKLLHTLFIHFLNKINRFCKIYDKLTVRYFVRAVYSIIPLINFD